MNKKILVPLGQYERSEEIIPYIQNVARPGKYVTFSRAIRWKGSSDGERNRYCMRAATGGKKLVNYYSWEEQPRKQ